MKLFQTLLICSALAEYQNDDEERELYQKEKANQRQVQYQSAAQRRDEKKKRKQDPKKWENGKIPKKKNSGAKNEKEMIDLEMRKIREHERMRNRENRKRRETDDNEENGKEELSDDDLPYPLEYFGAQEEKEEDYVPPLTQEDYVPPLTQEQLYKDYLKVHEITKRLFQTRGDMEFDAVWEKVKNQIPWSFSKGKADSKLKDIFQRQANKVQDDEKNRMLAAAEAKRQRDQKEAIA